MKTFTLWMMAAILICSPVMLTSCSSEDNPTGEPAKEEKSQDRVVFEKILSEKLAQAAQDVRFESAMTSTKSLTEFLQALDENALKDQPLEGSWGRQDCRDEQSLSSGQAGC